MVGRPVVVVVDSIVLVLGGASCLIERWERTRRQSYKLRPNARCQALKQICDAEAKVDVIYDTGA